MVQQSSYIVISPVRNEEKYIEKTIQSVVSQTTRPLEWIIVNDGSTDGTGEIIRKYAEKYQWIKLVNRTDRGFTAVGKGVIEVFNEGLKNVNYSNWSFIVKLDGDLSFDNDFFEKLVNKFHEDKKMGIAGGTAYVPEKGHLYKERMPSFHPHAVARMYRRECFEQIGGLAETLGWDTIDLLRAQMKGWQTRRYEDIKIIHHRRMASRNGLWEGKVRTGRNFYITAYHPLFLIARSVYRLKEKPYFVESFGVIWGYLQAMWNREPLVVMPQEKAFLQKQQLKRLLLGLRV